MQCKSLDVCRGKMSLCAFTIMVHASCGFFPESVNLCVLKGETSSEAACVCPGETDTLALSPTVRDMRRRITAK